MEDFEDILKNFRIEDFKNFGKSFMNAEEVLKKIEGKESLAGVRITGIDLEGVDLSGFNLEGAMIFNTNLKGANLENARLCNAVFHTTDLSGVVLSKADLSLVKLTNTNCDGVNFSDADLTGLNAGIEPIFTKNPLDIHIPPEIMEMVKKDPSDIDFSSLDLELEDLGISMSDFEEGQCSMKDADFSRALLQTARFDCILLDNASFADTQISNATFVNCSIPNADFSNSRCERVVFDNTDMKTSKFTSAHMQSTSFAGCDLTQADFSQSAFDNVKMSGIDLSSVENLPRNLPYCVFRPAAATSAPLRVGVAIGDQILDLTAAGPGFGGLAGEAAKAGGAPFLNVLMSLGPQAWSALRLALSRALSTEHGNPGNINPHLVAMKDADSVDGIEVDLVSHKLALLAYIEQKETKGE